MVALKNQQIEVFLNNPDQSIKAILIYGSDRGLILERSKITLSKYTNDPNDPFLVSKLDDRTIQDRPESLADELLSINFNNSRKVVYLNIDNPLPTKLIKDIFEIPYDSILIISTNELKPVSPLRKAFEKNIHAVTIPCYLNAEFKISQIIDKKLIQYNNRITKEAKDLLISLLGNDHQGTLNEIDKLCTLVGENNEINITDVKKTIYDSSQSNVDELIDIIFEKKIKQINNLYNKSLENNINAIQVLISAQRHASKLLHIFNIINIEKKSVSQAISEYKPVIFFQRRDSIIKQINKWSQNSIMKTIKILSETEEDSRNFPTLSDIVIERGLMKISTLKNK